LAISASLTLAATSAFAQTETQYVIEQLVVSVNAAADGSGDRVDQIKSGDRVEVLEREGEQSHVRLPSGQEGWVRTSYLSATPPLREQLKARSEELEKLRAEKTKLEADLASARKAASVAAAAVAATPAPAPSAAAAETKDPAPVAAAPADTAPPSNPPLFASDPAMPSRPSWLAAILASLATLVAGFVLGWRVLDKRIRAKYGGLRIY
jgi:SH3 domain protein